MNKKTGFVVHAYLTGLALVFCFLRPLFPDLFQPRVLLQYDALLYQEISQTGYEGYKMAFFPLFPKVWSLLGLGPVGMSVINTVTFFSSLHFLQRYMSWTPFEMILVLATPGLLFFFVPYSEAFFFAGATMLLFGLKRDKEWSLYAGLLICGLARPAYTIFVPALIILELYSRRTAREKGIRIAKQLFVIVLSSWIVAYIQFLDTGAWFKFFEAQSFWGNKLQLPQFPLRSWGEEVVVRLDGLSFLIGIVCTLFVVRTGVLRFRGEEILKVPPTVLFSALYVAGISFAVLLFRGGSLFSLNRFVFSTPFIFILLVYFWREVKVISYKWIQIIFFGSSLLWLFFGSYVHIQFLLKFALLSLFCVFFLLTKSEHKVLRKWSILLVLLVMFEFQIYIMIRYLDGFWVG